MWKLARLSVVAALFGWQGMAVAAPPVSNQLSAASCESFGFSFYRQLAGASDYQQQNGRNIAISPLSLASVLEVLRLGATGESLKELTAVLHTDTAPNSAGGAAIGKSGDLNSKGITLSEANSLWLDDKFHPKSDFLHRVDSEFGSTVFNLDFSHARKAADRINGWISDNTAGRIKDLLNAGDIPPVTAMIVANAVYFKGQWETPFDSKRTADAPFHLASGKEVSAKMMHRTARFSFAVVDDVKVLELPYLKGTVSMLLLLPEPGDNAMARLEGLLRNQWFTDTLAKLGPQRVNVSIPRFTFTCEPAKTVAVLQALGLTRIFKPGPDFEPISAGTPLYVGLFKHRAWLQVDEQGTEAAAATAMGMVGAMAPSNPVEFIADRPFLFVIRHNATGALLFVGRLSNPSP